MFVGLILIVIGVVFFARALGYIEGETISVLWPLLLIVLGLGLLSNKFMGHDCKGESCWCGGNVDWGNKKGRRKSKK